MRMYHANTLEPLGDEWGRGNNGQVLSRGLTGENLAHAEGALALWHLDPHLPHFYSNFRIKNTKRKGDRLFFVLPDPLPFWFMALQSQHTLFPTRKKAPLRKYLDIVLGQH